MTSNFLPPALMSLSYKLSTRHFQVHVNGQSTFHMTHWCHSSLLIDISQPLSLLSLPWPEVSISGTLPFQLPCHTTIPLVCPHPLPKRKRAGREMSRLSPCFLRGNEWRAPSWRRPWKSTKVSSLKGCSLFCQRIVNSVVFSDIQILFTVHFFQGTL